MKHMHKEGMCRAKVYQSRHHLHTTEKVILEKYLQPLSLFFLLNQKCRKNFNLEVTSWHVGMLFFEEQSNRISVKENSVHLIICLDI